MKDLIEKMIPIPDGYNVLKNVITAGDSEWIYPEDDSQEFLLAQLESGTVQLYRIRREGCIVPDHDSVLVRYFECSTCGEYMIPANDMDGRPTPEFYYCSACDHTDRFVQEDDFLWKPIK